MRKLLTVVIVVLVLGCVAAACNPAESGRQDKWQKAGASALIK